MNNNFITVIFIGKNVIFIYLKIKKIYIKKTHLLDCEWAPLSSDCPPRNFVGCRTSLAQFHQDVAPLLTTAKHGLNTPLPNGLF